MEFDLATAHGAFGTHGTASEVRHRTKAGCRPGTRVWAAIKHLGSRLAMALRPVDPNERYLAQAQNHADLERRMRNLMNPERNRFGGSY